MQAEVYRTDATPASKDLKWINSLGNHDVLGLQSGVDAQIAYQGEDKDWILPGRHFAADVKAIGGPSVRFHVLHTSCFVSKYRTSKSAYYNNETQICSEGDAVNAQISSLNASLTSSDADWDIVTGHHPAVSTTKTSYFSNDQKTPTADGWTPLAKLIAEHKPVAYFNGHDHAMSFQYLPNSTVEGETKFTRGFPKTGFYTSGAGSWAQAGDGGFGLDQQFSWSKYTNVDLDRGVAWGGFLIVTVSDTSFEVEYYSSQSGKDVQFKVTTKRNGEPKYKVSPYLHLKNDIVMDAEGTSVAFRKLLQKQQPL